MDEWINSFVNRKKVTWHNFEVHKLLWARYALHSFAYSCFCSKALRFLSIQWTNSFGTRVCFSLIFCQMCCTRKHHIIHSFILLLFCVLCAKKSWMNVSHFTTHHLPLFTEVCCLLFLLLLTTHFVLPCFVVPCCWCDGCRSSKRQGDCELVCGPV